MLVRWNKGTLKDGTDSLATQIISENEWPSLRAFVLITRLKFFQIFCLTCSHPLSSLLGTDVSLP